LSVITAIEHHQCCFKQAPSIFTHGVGATSKPYPPGQLWQRGWLGLAEACGRWGLAVVKTSTAAAHCGDVLQIALLSRPAVGI
jgi:hypothetical protein